MAFGTAEDEVMGDSPSALSPSALSPAEGLLRFERDVAAIVDRLADVDTDAPVPTCPGWTVTDLILHLGEVHQWVGHAILEGNPEGGFTPPERTDRESLRTWYRGQAGALADLLRATDPDTPVWNFGPKPRVARFWFTRQAHEVAIHRIDLAAAAGDPLPLPDEAAAIDGIGEIAEVFYPRQVRLGRIEPIESGVTFTAGGHSRLIGERSVAEVSGPASVLQPVMWGRIDPTDPRVTITGDLDAVRRMLAAGIIP